MQTPDRARRIVAETVGSALLLSAIVGSGVMADRLAGGNVAIALLANTIATGAALVALILTFGPVSGAHFKPAVTIADASQGGIRWGLVPGYVGGQLAGACLGVLMAHVMFGEPLFMVSLHARSGPAQMFSEFVATFGLLVVIWDARGGVQRRSRLLSRVHHLRVLVHGLDVIRESRRDYCSEPHRHLCGDSTSGRTGFHRGATSWRGHRDVAVPLACASRARACERNCPASRTDVRHDAEQ